MSRSLAVFVLGLLFLPAVVALAAPTAPNVVVVEESVWVDFADEAPLRAHNARKSILEQKYKEAAADVRKIGAYLTNETARAEQKSKATFDALAADLASEARVLDEAAHSTKEAVDKHLQKFDQIMARVFHALSVHHLAKASEAAARKDSKAAGKALHAARVSLENGLHWASVETNVESGKAMRDVLLVESKVLKGAGWVETEFADALQSLGKESDRLGARLATAKVHTDYGTF